MSKIKSSKEWLLEMESRGINVLSEQVKVNMLKLLTDVREQCRNATLEVAAEEGEIHWPAANALNPTIDMKQILSLKDSEQLIIN